MGKQARVLKPGLTLGSPIWRSTLGHGGAVDLEEMLADSPGRKAMVKERA